MSLNTGLKRMAKAKVLGKEKEFNRIVAYGCSFTAASETIDEDLYCHFGTRRELDEFKKKHEHYGSFNEEIDKICKGNYPEKFTWNGNKINVDHHLVKKLQKENKNFINHSIDIRNSISLSKIFNKYKKNIALIIHCAAQPSHDYGKNHPMLDFEVNARGTLNLLELTKKFCPDAPFIFMSTNKIYGDNPNKLKFIENKTRWELRNNDFYFKGIDENFSMDN